MIKLVIADDHPIVIDGIETILQGNDEIEIVGTVSNGAELIAFLDKNPVDVVLLDINMPKLNGIDSTKKISINYPDVNILGFSQYDERRFVKRMLRYGAKGYLLKNSSVKIIVEGIKTVAKGERYLSKELEKSLSVGRPKYNSSVLFPTLTPREVEIVGLIADGLYTTDIAKKLQLSQNTIETHRSNILRKTGVKNSFELIKWAVENDIV